MTAKECPNCRLASPGSASFCACGWDFEAGAMRVARPRPSRTTQAPPLPQAHVPPAATAVASHDAVPPLWTRVFAMPFLPPLWSRAAGWRFLEVALPVVLLGFLLAGALSFYRSLGVAGDLRQMADAYDAAYPAVVVAGGKVRVEGDRVIQWVDGRSTFLIDPRETVPLESIKTAEYLVVRETKIIRKQSYRTQITEVADVQALFGDPLRFDSASLRAFERKWGSVIQLGLGAGMAFFMMVGDLLGLAYVAAAAGMALVLRGKAAGLGFGACFRAALAPYGLTLVLSTAANLAGLSIGFCVGVWLWPLLLTGLATWAVARAGPEMSVARVADHF